MSMHNVESVKKLLEQGKKLILAGDENILSQLPTGHWIGGTIPYFMTENGGELNHEKIYVTELPSYVKKVVIRTYSESTISDVYKDAPANGFSLIIIPAASPILLSFAMNAPEYESFAASPLIGWVSGVHVDDIGKIKAKVFFGEKGKALDNSAVVMHVELPSSKYSEINLVNIFKQGTGDIIIFDETGFSAKYAYINGKKMILSDYIKTGKFDIKLPIVANYNGAMINVSYQGIDEKTGAVNFYAPVFKGVEYKYADVVGDYVSEFTTHMPTENVDKIFFSCNCILNYLYSELEGKATGGITGPITFGEIAYQLLNQTMAYITISDV